MTMPFTKVLLRMRDNTSGLLKSVFIALIVKVLGAGAAFAATVFIARNLGVADSGIYFLAFSIITFFSAFGRLGLDGTVLRFTSSGNYSSEDVFVKSTLLVLFVSSIVSALIYMGAPAIANVVFSKPELTEALEIMAPSVIGLSLISLVAASLQAMRKVTLSIFSLNIGVNVSVVVFVLLAIDLTVKQLAFGFTASVFLVLLAVMIIWYRLPNKSRGNKMSWAVLLGSCMPLCVVLVVNQIIQWSGQMVAGIYLQSEFVALLAAAQRTAMLTSFVLMAVNWVIAPRLSKLFNENKIDEISALVRLSVRWMFLASTPVVSLMLIFPDSIMSLFGEGFEDSGGVLIVFAVGQFVNVVTGPAIQLLVMSGFEKDVRTISIFVCIFALVSAFFLTANFGVYGSAVATASSVILNNLLALIYVRKRLGIVFI